MQKQCDTLLYSAKAIIIMRRLPIFILIDTSGSMFGEPIKHVNAGLATMLQALRQDPRALEIVHLSLITFDREARELFPLTPLEDIQIPTITCPPSGPAFMGAALKLVVSGVDRMCGPPNTHGRKKDWDPLLFLMTDGGPSDVALFDKMVGEIKRRQFGKIIACAAGPKANKASLQRLGDTVVNLETIDTYTLQGFFRGISVSVGMISSSVGIDQSERHQHSDIPITDHRSCFFAFDYNTEDNFRLLKWLREYFRRKDLGVEVIAPVDAMPDLNIYRSLDRQLRQVHFGIAEISNNNHNVLHEIGILRGLRKPIILLQRENSEGSVPFDIRGDFRAEYAVHKRRMDIRFTWLEEDLDKAMNTVRRMLPEFENVPKWEHSTYGRSINQLLSERTVA
uniref:Uncharacterized conserved protein YegL, contains vWA domain of TerY type n=1 Tax=Candidatus Kentrum sp. DK TaxID=2126562 RepID=A0A450S457_9GAMM|nr:MAG: Uncharacterized conserved protein YegL, contains vWA domain of TerY type [Candidatus Kentron sp. DK]